MHEALTRIQWAARQVVGPALENSDMDGSTLERLQASVARQTSATRALRQRLVADGADPGLQSQATELLAYLEEMSAKLEVRLGRQPGDSAFRLPASGGPGSAVTRP